MPLHIAYTVAEVRRMRWSDSALTWGLVPTMGALHAGHRALIRAARQENARVGVSIFVNPIQFNNPSDLENYPHPLEQDLALLEAEGVDLVWIPEVAAVYPPDFQTEIHLKYISQPLEGIHRPGHFIGVATVVAKLFNVFQPTRAYFGQKDAQQVAVIQQMVRDLNFNLEIVVVPTVREADGLAMSSRNTRLSATERQTATVLVQALRRAVSAWENGEIAAEHLRQLMRDVVLSEPLARLDYVSVADPLSLQEINGPVEQALLSLAVYIGDVRLIDNMQVG
jgi:pantoate--beta-alanine ligase